jgi:hypothetical protein
MHAADAAHRCNLGPGCAGVPAWASRTLQPYERSTICSGGLLINGFFDKGHLDKLQNAFVMSLLSRSACAHTHEDVFHGLLSGCLDPY